ncbi:MAG: ribosome silencing factor [Actinomycetes bacterium]|jgi:ribosome-associated protein|nr:MAG: ribosome silencing factor [Actinomycetota bacterium]
MAADAIFSKKGTDIVLLDVSRQFLLADVFVIATGTSRPHVQALAEHVEEKLGEAYGIKPLRVEGATEAEWVLMDYGDVIVHIFQPSAREYYALERLWGDATRIRWEEPAPTESSSTSEV